MLKDDKFITTDLDSQVHSLETVAKVSAAAASILDPEELLQTAADLVKTNFDLYHAHIYLLNITGDALVLAAGAGEVGKAMKARGHQIPLNHEHSLVARAAQTRHAITVNDVSKDQNFLANPLLPLTHSEMAVPMLVGGALVGVLDVQDDMVNRFTDEDARVQTILAEQLAVAIQNAQAFSHLQRAQLESKRMFDNSIDMVGTAGFDGYFKDVNAAWERTLGYTRDELLAAPFISFVHPDDVEPTNSEFAREMAAGSSTISFENRYLAKDGSYHWMSWNAVPLPKEGIIYFVTRDITNNKRLEAETTRRANDLEAITRVSAATTGILDLNEMLQAVSDLTKASFNLYHAHIYLLDESGKTLYLAAGAGEVGRTLKQRGHQISLDHEHSLVAQCAREHQGVVVNDVTQNPNFLPNPLLPLTRSEMAVPLLVGKTLLGVLDVQSEVVGRFTDEDVRIKTTLGDQIAIVIQNDRTFEERQYLQQETELLYNVASRLSGAKNRQDLLTAVSDYAISRGGAGATLLYFDLDEKGNPYWGEIVAQTDMPNPGLPIGARINLTGFEVAKVWMASPETPVLIPNTQDPETIDQATREIYAMVGQIAVAIMPLYLQGRWVGLVQCQWDKPQQFTDQDRRIYAAMGSQLAAVVDAVRSSEALAAAHQESDLLYNVSRRLSGAKSRQDLLTAVSDYSISRGGAGATLMYFDLDEQGNPDWGEVVAEIHVTGEPLPVGARLKLQNFAIAKLTRPPAKSMRIPGKQR